ncbi:MAG: DnaD domain protein [Anaerostipes sp.]|uniref:DnaD domain protein n=1 Tax=Anaerostipes sp. TaxID=1872530 RepID=UPI003970BA69
MNYIKVTTTYPTGGTLLPNAFVDNYMIRANGEYIKVYIYLLRMVSDGANFSIPCLADVLELTERDVTRALKYWEKESLLRMELKDGEISFIELLPVSGNPHSPEQISNAQTAQPDSQAQSITASSTVSSQTEQFTAKKQASIGAEAIPAMKTLSPAELQRKSEDERFSYLLYVCEMFLGKPLTCTDMNTLLYMIEDLKMSCELVEYLVEHCVSNGKKSFRYMQSVAINWYEANIQTPDEAKAYSKNFRKEYYSIMRAFGLNQNPAPVQEEYMKRWLETDGFDLPLIIEACNRTINAINKPSFPYADTILKHWKDNHIVTLEDAKNFHVQQKVPKTFANNNNQNTMHNFTQRDYDFDALEQQLLQKQFANELMEN